MKPSRLAYVAMSCALVFLAACKSTPQGDACTAGGDPARCNPAPVCNAPMLDCKNGGVDGCETNAASDLEHCGRCDNRCSEVTNGNIACTEGACVIAGCTAPYLNCNRSLNDGCEANSSRDAEHCGDCGTRCPTAVNASPACSAGKCKFNCNSSLRLFRRRYSTDQRSVVVLWWSMGRMWVQEARREHIPPMAQRQIAATWSGEYSLSSASA